MLTRLYKGGEYTNDNSGVCRNGQGTHTWANGRVYSGGWKEDKIHGQGCLTFPNGSKYFESVEEVVDFGYESLRSAQQLGRESVQKVHFLMILSILKRLRK